LIVWDVGVGYLPGQQNIDGDIGSLGRLVNAANEFSALVAVRTTVFE
jgi:hypothetical protein